MTTDCIPARTFYGAGPKHIEADFSVGTITSHAGLLLAGLAEGHLGLFERIAECFVDFRNRELIVHEVHSMVGQRGARLYGVAARGLRAACGQEHAEPA